MFSFKKNSPKTLMQIDDLYHKVISKFPDANRMHYCESLIYRTQKDLSATSCFIKKRKLKTLLKAAISEMKKIKIE